MKIKYKYIVLFTLLMGILWGCGENKTTIKDSDVVKEPVFIHHEKRSLGYMPNELWFSNEFESGRLNDVRHEDESTYLLYIHPEIEGTELSPWYAMNIVSQKAQRINVWLNSGDKRILYPPKISQDGVNWQFLNSSLFKVDTASQLSKLQLDILPGVLWLSPQGLLTSSHYQQWQQGLLQQRYVTIDDIGKSVQDRVLSQLTITEARANEVRNILVVLGRIRPADVHGGLALLSFINTMVQNSNVSRVFRQNFEIWVLPLVNPDGVEMGYWQYNANGVDLEYDWFEKSQPETKAIHNISRLLLFDPLKKPYYFVEFQNGNRSGVTFSGLDSTQTAKQLGVSKIWYDVVNSRSNTTMSHLYGNANTPNAKNWFNKTFNIDGVNIEIGPDMSHEDINMLGTVLSKALMEILAHGDANQ